jgi:hypothetical protein
MIAIAMVRRALSELLSGIAATIDPTNPDNTPRKSFKIEHFEHPDGNYIELFVDCKGLTHEEVRVNRLHETLTFDVVPDYADGLVLHPESPRNAMLSLEAATERFERFGHLTWSKSSALEISEYFQFCLEQRGNPKDDMWGSRALHMSRALIEALVGLRDSCKQPLTAKSFKKYLSLDCWMELANDQYISGSITQKLMNYLIDLPGYNTEDALQGQVSPRAYDAHGYLTMQVVDIFTFDHSIASKNRTSRPQAEHYKHVIGVPFKSVKYAVVPEGLVITVQYHPNSERVGKAG